jgi:uncharacterized protein (DUF4415 family)
LRGDGWERAAVRAADGAEDEARACEIRLRAERKAGQLLAHMDKLNGRPKKGSTDTRLSDLGISHDQSSQWQKLGALASPRGRAFGALRPTRGRESPARTEGATMSAEQQRRRVSTRVDAEVIEVIRRVAQVERRPPSAVIRIALEDWATSRAAEQQEQAV